MIQDLTSRHSLIRVNSDKCKRSHVYNFRPSLIKTMDRSIENQSSAKLGLLESDWLRPREPSLQSMSPIHIIQLVVYYQCWALIRCATTRLYVIAH